MANKHHVSHASRLFYGNAYDPVLYASLGREGVEFKPVVKVSLGTPVVADVNYLVDGAATTEMPNAGTKTYTPATDGTSPLDNADTPAPAYVYTTDGTVLVWPIDVPRNITVGTSSAAADTVVTVTGYDKYLQKMVETITVASGQSTGAGKKAFAYVSSIAIYSAGDVTSDTLNVGVGDVLGLPFKISAKSDLMQVWFDDVYETTAPTVVVGSAATVTATTGDVRGTADINGTLNGSKEVVVYMVVDPSDRDTLLGITNYAG